MNKIIAIVVMCMVGCASLSDAEKRRYKEERRRDKQAYKLDVIKAKNTKYNNSASWNYNYSYTGTAPAEPPMPTAVEQRPRMIRRNVPDAGTP